MKIIDIHIHPRLDKHPLKSMERIIQTAQQFGVQRLCLLGDVLRFGYNPNQTQIRQINDLTIKLVKKWPKLLIGFCYLSPEHKQKFIEEEIQRCIIKSKFKGIKLEVAVNASDKRLDPIMEKAEKLKIPILHHSWNTQIINNRKHQSDPEDIANLASRFPKVKIIMAHLTASEVRGVNIIKPFPNIYADTSGSQPFSGIIEYAVKELGAERILYGSDAPGRDFSSQLGRIYGAKIKLSEKELIFGINAERNFGVRPYNSS